MGTAITAIKSRFQTALFTEVDIASLAFFRFITGILLFIFMWTVYQGHFLENISRPGFHCTHFGFDWVRPLPGNGVYYLVWVLRVLALGIAFGAFYRASAILFCLGYTYIFLIDSTVSHNHPYLVCLFTFLMFFMPANRAYSIDAWRKPELRSATTPMWPIWTSRLQFAVVYFFAGVAKLNYDWLHGEPIRSRLEHFQIGRFFAEHGATIHLCYAGLIFDLTVPFLLFFRRTRLAAFIVSVLFHFTNSHMWVLDIFPYFMVLGTLIFFPPDWPRRDLRGKVKAATLSEEANEGSTAGWSMRQRAIATFLVVYFAIQFLVPMRQFLYPGTTAWTNQGHTFAWRMMTVWKRSIFSFQATDPGTGETWKIYPEDFGAPKYGPSNAWCTPHNALLFAHHAAKELREQGHPNIEIRAEIWCSLNYRKPQLLIDPSVDLAAQPRTLLHMPWITELTEPLPLTPDERIAALDAWEARGGSRREY